MTALGLTGVDNNAFPRIAPRGHGRNQGTAQERRQAPITNVQFVESLSRITGKHSLKFGVEFRKSLNYEINL